MVSCEINTVTTKVSKRKHSSSEDQHHQQQVLLRSPVSKAQQQQQETAFINVPHDGTLHQPSKATPVRSSLKKSSLYESSPQGVDLLHSSFNAKNIKHLLARLELLETVERALEIVEDSNDDLEDDDNDEYFEQQRAARLEQYASRWQFSLRHDPPFL